MLDLISVIIPVYNVERYISKCIESVLNQMYANLQIILVDDGSTDKSGEICDRYAKRDNRIHVIHKSNGGLSDARNAGLDIASGRYIGFVDGDDYIDSDMYELLRDACIRNDAEIAICGRKRVREDGKVIDVRNTLSEESIFTPQVAISRLLVWDNCDSAAWDKLYRRELFTDIRYPFGKLHEDLNITTRLFSKSTKIVQITAAKYNYLIRDDSICRKPFSDRRFDLYYQAKANQKFVYDEYPELKAEADYFVWHCALGVLSSLVDSRNPNLEYYSKVKELVKCEKNTLYMNKYVGTKEKMEYLKKMIKFYIQNMMLR